MNSNFFKNCNKRVFLLVSFLMVTIQLRAQKVTIPISSENHMILMQTDNQNRLRTIYFGKPLQNLNEFEAVGLKLYL